MKKASLSDRLRYAFDNTLSRGPIALIGWLALVSGALIVIISLIVWILGIGGGRSLVEILWMSLLRTLDSGTMGGDQGSWPFLFSMLAITFGGIFVISTLIGVLTSGIEERLERLRKGRSRVMESGHTVILGWSEQIHSVLSELIIANANLRKPRIVILGHKDKVEMEDEIRDKVGSSGRTRIICRTGSPIDMQDLEIVNIHASRSVIVLSPGGADPDAEVIKTILAITKNPNRRTAPYHIVAELRDPKNLEVAQMVGRGEVELILVGDLISRVIAQTCRQSGLSVVYTELLDFGGDEIYFHHEPALVGKTFGEAVMAYEESAVIGLHPRGGSPQLNPPMETRIGDGDQIVAISEDDDTILLSGLQSYNLAQDAVRQPASIPKKPERTLILGWNWRAPTIIRELDHYVARGSLVTVVADYAEGAAELKQCCAELQNQSVPFGRRDTTDRRTLDELNLPSFDHVIVLSYSDMLDPQHADARTLVTLLHMRDIADRTHGQFSIVSEILDLRNRKLAEVTRADDFIVSEKLISLMLSQVSENKALNAVFADIFDPQGSEIYLKSASDYVALGTPVNFYTVAHAARGRGELAFGYRLQANSEDAENGYGVVVNPDKSQVVTFTEADRIIVLAEE